MFSSSAVNWVAIATPAKLKRKGFCKTSENRKEICVAAKAFHEAALLGTVHQLHGWACPCAIRRKGTQF